MPHSFVGHNGVDRTLTRLFSLQQVWKHMKQHVRTFIQNCPCCQKLSAKDPKTNASHFATSNYAIFDTLNVDYIGPFPDKGYILVIITRWTELFWCANADAKSAADCTLLTKSISAEVIGSPNPLHSSTKALTIIPCPSLLGRSLILPSTL